MGGHEKFPPKKKKKLGGGRGENKVAIFFLRSGQTKKSALGMAQG